MSTWNIYHKDGSKLTDVNGEQITVHGLEYSDSWMGECFLTINFKHEVPINFQIGDYIIYRNERFELNYEPGKDKQARPNTYGEGFVYDSVKFNALQDELARAEFLDVVLNDNELHYTALPKFPFFVQTLDDLLDRIQANLDEQIGAGLWKIYSRNKERSVQRGCLVSEWLSMYGEGTSDNVIESMSITIDSKTCWEALALVNEKWNVNFIVRGRNIYVGTTGIEAGHIFSYGLGKGLYEIVQNADSDQSVITRLRAYGSEKNLPSHYYADLGVKYVANITKVVTASTNVELELDLDYIETYFKNKRKYVVSGESQEQSNGWVLQVTFDFQTTITGYVTQSGSSGKCRFYSEFKGGQVDSGDEESKEKLDAFISQVKAGNTKMYITSGLNKKAVPSSMKEYAKNLPNNMSINRLMLPGFPHVSLSDFYDSLTEQEKKYVNPTGKLHRFSTDPYRPYIDSLNIEEIGLRSASQFFDTDDKTNGVIEIYPTIEEMEIGGVRVDEIDEGVAPNDDGRFGDNETVKNVDIYLNKAIDFDINDLKDDDFSISMKDGMCGGRTFKVASSTKVDGRWRLTIERSKDDALELWFPYKDYPIKNGDHFVLTGITLPDSYVNAASLKLLKYAIALLDKNDYTRYVYQPKVDELFMARQHDLAQADETGVIKSLHDTLKAGDLMNFNDTDLNIEGIISIDQLTIKEEDGKIPTYDITLREDKEVGTIQKIQQQISSLQSGNGGTGAGLTTTQVKNQVATEGSKHFISKINDDTANGTIIWEKVQKLVSGLLVGNLNNENGGSWTPDAEGRSHLITDYLEVRMKAIFEELVIKKTSTISGKEIISPAGGVVAHKVEEVTVTYNNVSQKTYRCYFLAEQEGDSVDNDFAVNDQVRSESFNVRKGTYHKVGNHFYWRLVIGRDEEPVELEGKKYHYIDLSDTDCATASDVPAKGDVLSQCGNRTDVERQNCLIFSAVDTYSPSISLYHGINSYSFANREYVQYGVNKQTNKAFFNVYGDMYVGDRPTKENGYEGSSYIKYDSAAKQVSVKGKISAKSTVDGKELSQYIKENSAGGLTEEQVNNLIKNSQVITDLQNQVDGAIETWFYDGVPTLKNAPASSWTTDKEKDTHLGDLYYDNKTGKAYRFAKDGNTYKWTIITDTDIAKALSDASKAQETADGKMKVFSTQPIPPYQVGDIWVNATYPTDGSTYKNEVLRCQTLKAAGSPFAIADWIKASKYTDDTVANAAKAAAEKAQKAAEKAQGDISKLETTVTTNKKAFDSYVTDGYLEPSEIAAMAQDSKRLEDAFAAAEKSYNEVKGAEVLKSTKELTDLNTAFTTLSTAKTELIKYLSDISARYNAANTEGKATIVSAVGTKFTNFQSAYSAFYDKLGLANAYITSKIYGDLKQNITDLAGYKYIKDALGQTTDIDGGLVMTTLLALRDADGNVQSGINGAIDQNRGKKSIATWWGGRMVDKDYNSGSLTPATSLIRFDGSGYLANGAIWWDVDGKVHADPTSFIISEKNLGAYLTFFEPTWKAGSDGSSIKDLVALTPQAPFKTLSVSNDLSVEGKLKIGSITLSVVNGALKIDGNVYSTGGMSAYGEGTSNGGGLNGSIVPFDKAKSLTAQNEGTEIASAWSIKKLYDMINSIDVTGQLTDYLKKTEASTLYQPKGNYLTSHQDISGKSDKTHTHSVKINGVTKTIAATGGTAVDLGTYLTSHQSLAAYLKSADAEKTYSKLGHTHAFSEITGKPTTLAGYGVTDGVNAVSVTGNGNAVTSASIDGHTLTLTKGSTFSLSGHTHTFASLTSKPTTIAGYGITDAYTKAQVDSTIAKYLPLAGGTITGALTVNGIATFKSKVAIGDIYIINDGSGNLYVQKTDGKTAANFYATGGITAYGAGTSTSGGGGLNASVISYARIIEGSYTDADLTSIPNAYAIKALSSRIDNIATELGGLSLSWNNITGKPSTFAPSAHTHKWAEITDRITKVSQLTNDAGYLTAHQSLASYYTKAEIDAKGYTTNKGTVTSVALTLPTGLTCATKTITTSGTFAISLASGYSIPTTAKQTAWDGAVSAKHTHSNKSVLDGITSTKVTRWDSAYDWYALMTTDEETADGIINKWNEVVSFLANIAQTDTLSGIVDGINKSISDEVARAKKAEGVNASGISANKGSIATLQGYFTNGSAKKALQLTNARKLWGNSFNGTADINGSIIVPDGKYISIGNIKMEYDATNKALKITNTTTNEVANLYTSGGVSAYGVGTSSSGGGLNGSVKAYADAIRLTTENLSEIASAYSVAKLYSEIQNVASAVPSISVSVPTGGNALTGATYDASTGVITFAKGTFLTAHQSLDGYVNAIAVSGSGNAVTAVTKSGKTITLTKGSSFSLSNHTHYIGTTQVQGSSAEQALTGITKIDNILKLSKASVTVNTSYKAEQNRLVIYGSTYGNDANYIKSAGKLSYGDGGPQLVFSTGENPDASGAQSAALVYTDHDKIGAGVSLSFVTNQGDAYFIAPHIKALTAFQGNLAWSYITNKPTTLSGFGITDGLRSVTQPSGSNVFVTGISTSGTAVTYTKSYTKKSLSAVGTSGWTNASIDGNIIPDMSFIAYWNGAYSGTSSNLAYCNKGAFGSFAIKNSLAFSELTSKPTTISGYGITDAYTKSQVDAIAAKYLPLTGGTLTGQLKIVASALNGAYNGLRIGDDCYIGDCNLGNTIGLMGVSNNNAGMVKFGKGGMQFGYNGSNHIASTTAQWTNLNADLLDGWHKDNIVWSGAVNSNTASLSHYWAKLFDITVTGNQYDDRSFTFLFSNGYNDTYSVVVLRIRQNGAKDSGAYNFSISLRELVGNMSSRLRVYYNNATGNVQLWGNCQGQYGSLSYTIIKKTGRTSADFTSQGTLVTNTSFSEAQSLPATTGDSPYTLLDGATRIGIVKQADQLVTARSLWGQSFNGTANVSGNMTGVGNINTSAAPAGTIYTNNWFRSKGSTGWYSEDHGGGWYMSDNTWIRNFGSKDVYLSNRLSVNGNVGIGTTAPSHKLHVSGEIYTTTKVNINGIVLEKDSDGNLKVNGNLYATGGISAYGASDGTSSGGGLNGSVKSYADALKLTSESLSEIASAYSIKQLSTRISSLEGGSATSISVSGSGNAVTSVTKNGTTISVVKGSTFLTAHQSLAGYMKTATADAKYMYHSRDNIVSDLNSFATNGAAHIYEMNNVTNRPNSNSWVQVMNWGTGDSAYGFLLANDYSTNGHMYFRQKIAGSWKDWKTIIDSSNIGSQSVNYAASAGSVAWTNVSGRPSTMKNPSALSWSGYSSGSYDGSAAKSISIPNNTNQLTNGAGFITASASITGNAASATKLQTTRTLWGQSFNGTANISGSMTGVGDMTLDAGARIKHGSGNLYIGNSDNSNWIGVQDICSQSSIGDGNWSLRTSGAAHFKDTTINGTATIKNLLSLVDGSHKGLKMGSTYISSLDGEVILQGNTALRFGNDAWDYNQWAGLKYDHSIKTVYLGIADGSIFKANSAQSGGVINLKQGISSVYTPTLYAGGDIYHTGAYRMLWKNSKASKYLNVMNISQDDNGILTIGYGNFSNNKNVVLEGYNLNFRVGNDSGMKSMWLNYNNGNPVLSLDGNFYATGGVTAYKSSDERLKHDIHGVDSLAIIKAMGGTVAFRYNADNKDSIGWIAQRVLHNTFMQDLVEKDDKGFLKINYWSPKLIAVAFGAIEQVDDEVSRLKRRVRDLENEVEQLKSDRL